MIEIKDYILLSKEERQKHIDLTLPCLERGGFSTKFSGLLAENLGTSITDRKRDGVNVHLCHACGNEKCSNIKHLYWGTPKENVHDAILSGKQLPNVWESSIRKYGLEGALTKVRENQSKAASLGGKATKGRKLSKEHRNKMVEGLRRTGGAWKGKKLSEAHKAKIKAGVLKSISGR